MNYTIGTKSAPCTLVIQLSSLTPVLLRVQVLDPTLSHTVLADRDIQVLPGQAQDCVIPMPVSPWKALVRIVDQGPTAGSDSFKVISMKTTELRTYRAAIDWDNAEIKQAISLGKRFCYNAGWLPASADGQAYCSPDMSLKLIYLPSLVDPKSGKESVTPMRISQSTSVMEGSQKLCIPYTVPGRAVMFYHEFSHKFENQQANWELEADLNGLTIYLALGFSKYEALQIYTTIFKRVDSPENRDRLAHIENFINNFEHFISKSKL